MQSHGGQNHTEDRCVWNQKSIYWHHFLGEGRKLEEWMTQINGVIVYPKKTKKKTLVLSFKNNKIPHGLSDFVPKSHWSSELTATFMQIFHTRVQIDLDPHRSQSKSVKGRFLWRGSAGGKRGSVCHAGKNLLRDQWSVFPHHFLFSYNHVEVNDLGVRAVCGRFLPSIFPYTCHFKHRLSLRERTCRRPC